MTLQVQLLSSDAAVDGSASSEQAQATVSVAEALAAPAGTAATVSGHVVGQPVDPDTVVTGNFPDDYALALADSAGETDTAAMIYVQIPATFRAEYGLRSNPELMGDGLTVTGRVEAYFAHDGLKSVTAMSAGGTEPEEPEEPGEPQEPGDYYADAAGLTGEPLAQALHEIISDSTTLTYSQVWEALRETDEDTNNPGNVILLYTGRSQSENENGGDPDQWNREHVWPQSHGDFGTAPGPGTDVHHLRPADVSVNAERGNKDFDDGGTQVAEAPGNFTDADSWEPRDAVKGDVARMIFYMSVRYEGGDGFADLEVNDQVDNGSAPFTGRLSVLREWHAEDPPDAFEQNRNQVIFDSWQHNRNPFIDHPEWVDAIWG